MDLFPTSNFSDKQISSKNSFSFFTPILKWKQKRDAKIFMKKFKLENTTGQEHTKVYTNQ
jgi:hypothetical protein